MNNLVEQVARGAFGFLGNRKGEDMMRLQRAESAIEQLDGRHGWKLVPVEPTGKMRTNGHAAGVNADGLWQILDHATALRLQSHYLSAAYTAALATAPDPLAEDKP